MVEAEDNLWVLLTFCTFEYMSAPLLCYTNKTRSDFGKGRCHHSHCEPGRGGHHVFAQNFKEAWDRCNKGIWHRGLPPTWRWLPTAVIPTPTRQWTSLMAACSWSCLALALIPPWWWWTCVGGWEQHNHDQIPCLKGLIVFWREQNHRFVHYLDVLVENEVRSRIRRMRWWWWWWQWKRRMVTKVIARMMRRRRRNGRSNSYSLQVP